MIHTFMRRINAKYLEKYKSGFEGNSKIFYHGTGRVNVFIANIWLFIRVLLSQKLKVDQILYQHLY